MTLRRYQHYKNATDWRWANFSPKEMASPDTGALEVEERLLDLLQALRYLLDRPLVITSGYRTPEYNNRISSTGRSGPHVAGRAVDIHCYGDQTFPLVKAALSLGFTGIGLRQHGNVSSRFVHLDILQEPPRPNIWTYP